VPYVLSWLSRGGAARRDDEGGDDGTSPFRKWHQQKRNFLTNLERKYVGWGHGPRHQDEVMIRTESLYRRLAFSLPFCACVRMDLLFSLCAGAWAWSFPFLCVCAGRLPILSPRLYGGGISNSVHLGKRIPHSVRVCVHGGQDEEKSGDSDGSAKPGEKRRRRNGARGRRG
jgi:hypothetical protein